MDSAIGACETALLALWNARNGTGGTLEGVSILPAGPTKDEDFTGEMIFLGDVTGDDDWSSLGAGRRRESFRVGVIVWVEQWGDDPATAKARMRVLWTEVRDAVVDDIRTGSTLRTAGVVTFDRVTYTQTAGPASPEKWGARCDAQLGFTARTV